MPGMGFAHCGSTLYALVAGEAELGFWSDGVGVAAAAEGSMAGETRCEKDHSCQRRARTRRAMKARMVA